MSKKLILTVLALGLASGCTSLDTLKRAEFKGNSFQSSLGKYYRDLAEYEAVQDDWYDYQIYADKTLMAAKGVTPTPDTLSKRDLPADRVAEIHEARGMLMSMLNNKKLEHKRPLVLAKAQTSFDCWVEQQEENWQDKDINACRDGFYDAMVLLEHPNFKLDMIHDTKTVYFHTGSAKIKPSEMMMLKDLAHDAKAGKLDIMIVGYTDTVGKEKVNHKLSYKRALEVRKTLAKHGVTKKHLMYHGYGEKRLAVPTADNVNEPKNRRVRLIIGE